MFLLDTNVVSETRKARPHGGVLAWLGATPTTVMHVSVVTLGELQAGVEATRRPNPHRAEAIEGWIDDLAAGFTVIPMEAETFRLWARLMVGKSQPLMLDAMIAATAIVHELTVATRNVKDFESFGVPLFNPFETPRV